MKVAELITELHKYNPDSEVEVYVAGSDIFVELIVEDSAVATFSTIK